MSRYSLKPLSHHADLFEVALGWDPGLDTFFVTVFAASDGEPDPDVRLWRGTTFREIQSAAALLAIVRDYAEVPEGLASRLEIDRLRNPHDQTRPISTLIAGLLGAGRGGSL